jgi:hypothetical protein
VFSQIMSSTSELKALLDSINQETEHVAEDGTFDRIMKVGGIYNDVVANYIKNTFSIENVTLENMQDVYSPLNNGKFDDMLNTRDWLIKQGLELNQANELAEKYITTTYEKSTGPYKFYQLIEPHLQTSQGAISSFHGSQSLRDVNFYTPSLNEFSFSVEDRRRKAGHLSSYLMAGGDINEYNKLANTNFKSKLANEPVRVKRNALSHFSTRPFCSKNEPKEEKKAGGFTAYLKKLMQVDKSVVEDDKKSLESIVTKNPVDIKIGFHKIKSSITLDAEEAVGGSSEAAQAHIELLREEVKSEEDLLIERANQQFEIDFFKEFSLTDAKLMQVSIEE